MDKRFNYCIAAVLLLLAACQVEEDNAHETDVNVQEPVDEIAADKVVAPEVTASQESDRATKSILEVDSEGVGTIYWTPADEINVFYGTTSTHYVSQNTTNATTAVFTTTDVIGSTESASDNIWGLYPYNPNATCDGTSVTTKLSSTQDAIPGTFDDDLFITLAHGSDTALDFYNVCGGIKFTLSRNDIQDIMFGSNIQSEAIAGNINIDFVDGKPHISAISQGSYNVHILPPIGQNFEAGKTYYIILLPRTLSSGFYMSFDTEDGKIGRIIHLGSTTIKRSVFSKKENIDVYAEGLAIPNNQIWYSTTTGAVLWLDDSFYFKNKDGDNIQFSSHEYYSTGQARIIFEEDLYAFDRNFGYKSALETIILPSSISYIPPSAFLHCINLKSVTLPKNITTIGGVAFKDCTALTEIDLPESLELIEYQAFDGCSSLSSVNISGDNLTEIKYNAFYGSAIETITIPGSVTKIGSKAFGSCTHLSSMTLLGTTPPTCYSKGIGIEEGSYPIYVPAEAIDTYKQAPVWSDCSGRIQAIP